MGEREPAHKAGEETLASRELTHSNDGVDLTLIRWMLSLTPRERLEVLQENLWSLMRLRGDRVQT